MVHSHMPDHVPSVAPAFEHVMPLSAGGDSLERHESPHLVGGTCRCMQECCTRYTFRGIVCVCLACDCGE